MKKLFVCALALAMLLALAACGSQSPTTGSAAEAKLYKVCYLVSGNLGDKSFFDSAETGLETLENAGRISLNTIQMGSGAGNQSNWASILKEVSAAAEYDLIVCGGYQIAQTLKEMAAQYPEQKYLLFDDATYAGESDNVAYLTFRQNELGYLTGVFAACMTEDAKVSGINEDKVLGFLGGVDCPVVNDFLYGFIIGAQSVDPDIRVDTRYVGDFEDYNGAKELVRAMIKESRCDVIWGVAGAANSGAALAALESGQAWLIGVDSDQETLLSSDQASVTLTSGLKNIGDAIIWFFDQWDADKMYWGQEVNRGLAEEGIGLVTDKNYDAYASSDTKAQVKKVQKDLTNGKITVPSTLGSDADTAGLEQLREAVRP